jgi:hypothetical protein
MQNALCDILIEQPYLYRYEIADFLYHRFRQVYQTDRSVMLDIGA